MNNNISERNLKAINMYQKGLTQKEISTKLRMCEKTLRKILKENNIPPYTKTINCNWCGKTFTTKYRHQNSCSESCRGKYNRRHRGKKQKCIGCGIEFYGYKINDYCSNECYLEYLEKDKRKKELITRLIKAVDPSRHKVCKGCKSKFYALNITREYCSNECRYKDWYSEVKKSRTRYAKECSECGKSYITTRPKSEFCSSNCRKRSQRRKDEIRRNKALKKNGKIDWDISLEKLHLKDKGICHICNGAVDMTKNYNHNLYGSIDHVIPISKGGTHTWDNVKLAHRICNTLKSDRLVN